jgi:RNA 2',3'-cyclic 3'-phosphodiesterase
VFLDEVAALAERLRGAPRLSRARWAAPATLHVTLRFFGETSDVQLAALRPLVVELAARVSRPLRVRAPSVSGFPSPSRAHVLITEVEDDGTLAELAARAEELAVALGFGPETRAYHPHLTLARMRQAVDVVELAGEGAALPSARVTAVTLYESKTGPAGPVYAPLERAALAAADPGA